MEKIYQSVIVQNWLVIENLEAEIVVVKCPGNDVMSNNWGSWQNKVLPGVGPTQIEGSRQMGALGEYQLQSMFPIR